MTDLTTCNQFNAIRARWHGNDWAAEDGYQVADRISRELTEFVDQHKPTEEIERGEHAYIDTDPSTIEVGDLVCDYGYIGRVVEIREYTNSPPAGRTCYQLFCEYVEGNLEMFNYFRNTTLNGTGPRDYRAMIQGNSLRGLLKVTN